MNFFIRAAANLLLSFLQSTIKNPKSIEKEHKILREIRDTINQLLPPE